MVIASFKIFFIVFNDFKWLSRGICYVTVVRRASESLKEEHSQMLVVQGARGEDTRGL